MAAFELDLVKDKGFELDLNKEFPTLSKLRFEVTWKEHPVNKSSHQDGYDLDLSVFALDAEGIVEAPKHILFFNNKNVFEGAGILPKDNRTGGKEFLTLDLTKFPDFIKQLDMYVNIFEAVKRAQTFLMMQDARVKLIDDEKGEDLITLKLTDYTNDNALHVVSLPRNDNGFTFKLVGASAAVDSGLNSILANYRP
jgi:tellurium resistance protein TerD